MEMDREVAISYTTPLGVAHLSLDVRIDLGRPLPRGANRSSRTGRPVRCH